MRRRRDPGGGECRAGYARPQSARPAASRTGFLGCSLRSRPRAQPRRRSPSVPGPRPPFPSSPRVATPGRRPRALSGKGARSTERAGGRDGRGWRQHAALRARRQGPAVPVSHPQRPGRGPGATGRPAAQRRASAAAPPQAARGAAAPGEAAPLIGSRRGYIRAAQAVPGSLPPPFSARRRSLLSPPLA